MTDFERQYVHNVYETIAVPFDQTRFCYWNAVKNFLDSLEPYSLVLDNGCGNGKYLNYRKDLCFTGNDMCLGLLEIAKKKADVTRSNGISLPYRNETFDAIICIAVFHHLSDPVRRKQFIQEMVRVLKPNGKLFVTVWAYEQPHNKRFKKWNVQTNGDAMIPWCDKKQNILSQRYYHLFHKEELEAYFKMPELTIESCIYEYDNWCITLQKSKGYEV